MHASPDLPDGWRLETLCEIDGTNAELLRRADAGEPEGLALRSDVQSAGRGRRGRVWNSPNGNLYFSVLVKAEPSVAGQIGFAGALALLEAIEAVVGRPLPELRCKWPNDLLLQRRKVAGLLLELAPKRGQVVLGMGVNLVLMDVVDAVYPVGSLAEFSIAPQELALNVCVAFARWLETWRMMGFAPLRRAWLERAHGLGEVATVRLVNEEFEGTFKGLSKDGALLLDQGGEGVKSVSAGEVFFGVGV